MEYKTQYDYYIDKGFLSTHGDFKSEEELKGHESRRREIFTSKLFLPPHIFKDAKLIEFGPDCGENSLIFAYWGANCGLVEPNPATHNIIKNYFERFKLKEKLIGIEQLDVKGFSEQSESLLKEKCDIIDAEGFIYTVKPNSVWINLFSKMLNPEGFVLIDYYEKFGTYIELFQKMLHSRIKNLTGMSSLEAARSLFTSKWEAIPHRRKLEVWVKDVLESPFVRLKYFIDAQELCEEMDKAGFQLYSSWPNYRDNLNIQWIRKFISSDEHLKRIKDTIAQSRLGYIFGRKHFSIKEDPALEKEMYALVESTDKLIGFFDEEKAKEGIIILQKMKEAVSSPYVLSDSEGVKETYNTIESLQIIMRLLIDRKADEVIKFCNEDKCFIGNWGMPSHFAVFQKRTPI